MKIYFLLFDYFLYINLKRCNIWITIFVLEYNLLYYSINKLPLLLRLSIISNWKKITQIIIAPSVDKGWIVIWIYIGNGQCLPVLRMIYNEDCIRQGADPV